MFRRILGLSFIGILVFTGLVVIHQPVSAQGGDKYPPGVSADDVYKIAAQIYCDVCKGVSIAYCPSDQCQAWREEIGDLLAQGKNEQEIKQHFADRYGEKVTGVPVSAANRRLTYGIPIALAVAAGLMVSFQVYQWRRRETRAVQVARAANLDENYDRPVPDNVDPAYLERLMKLLDGNK
ncbi:MAG: cytochrome c-type biogenesis protein CcmH [Chloroflexi bacterium]|nr:cytochrome c-type biogenesis protein CcmH [Chloroflexota bacterium]